MLMSDSVSSGNKRTRTVDDLIKHYKLRFLPLFYVSCVKCSLFSYVQKSQLMTVSTALVLYSQV